MLYGIQVNVLYNVFEDNNRSNGKWYSVEYAEGRSIVKETGKFIFFKESNRASYAKNEIYSMTDSSYHESDIPFDVLTCTLVTTRKHAF